LSIPLAVSSVQVTGGLGTIHVIGAPVGIGYGVLVLGAVGEETAAVADDVGVVLAVGPELHVTASSAHTTDVTSAERINCSAAHYSPRLREGALPLSMLRSSDVALALSGLAHGKEQRDIVAP
jgi:hypothetical protein